MLRNLFKLWWLLGTFFCPSLIALPTSVSGALIAFTETFDAQWVSDVRRNYDGGESDHLKDVVDALQFMEHRLGRKETRDLLLAKPGLFKGTDFAQIATHFFLFRLSSSEGHARRRLAQANARIGHPTEMDELVVTIYSSGLANVFKSEAHHFRKGHKIYINEAELAKHALFPWARAILNKGKRVFVSGRGLSALEHTSAREGYSPWIRVAPVCRRYIEPVRTLFRSGTTDPSSLQFAKALEENIPGFLRFWDSILARPDPTSGAPANHLGATGGDYAVQLDLVETVEGDFDPDTKITALNLLLGAAHQLQLTMIDRLRKAQPIVHRFPDVHRVLNSVLNRVERCERLLAGRGERVIGSPLTLR